MSSPDVDNLYIGKGIVSIQLLDEEGSTMQPVGNVPEFEFTPELEELAHFSSMTGVRFKDKTVVVEKGGTLRVVMEEFTVQNLMLATLGILDAATNKIKIFANNSVAAAVRFKGTNEVGLKYQWDFFKVDFIPSSGISLITDEWGRMELNGNLGAIDGEFGTITPLDDEGEPIPPTP